MSAYEPTPPLDRLPEWQAVMAHHETIRDRHLRDLFAEDPERATRLTADGAGLFLDYSKHRVTDETMELLLAVAKAAGVEERRSAMFAGAHINTTEDRPVLHTALRAPATFSRAIPSAFALAPGPKRQGHRRNGGHRRSKLP